MILTKRQKEVEEIERKITKKENTVNNLKYHHCRLD